MSRSLPLVRSASMLLAILCLVAGPVPAQQRFEEVTDVLVVEIPVQVTRDGKPVRGLTAADFEVLEGRKKRDIVGFEVVDLRLAPEVAAAQPVSASARRHFLLLFDLALSYPAAIVRARDAARELVESALHPSDLVAVGVYSSTRGAELVLGFTTDRRQVALAIETLGMPSLLQTRQDPLGIVFEDRAELREAPSEPVDSLTGLDAETELLELLEDMERSVGQVQERNKILALTGSLTELAGLMKAVEGNKHVVFLSEGFDSSILLGRGVDSAADQAAIQRANEAAMSGQVWEVKSDERYGNTSTLNQLEAMTEEFVRAGCTVQSVDIGGLRAGADVRARRPADDGLHMMASKTGGEYYRNFNNLSDAMGRMLERTSVTYLLAIQPDDVERDDKFRRLKVKLKNGGRDVRLAHRPGYFPPKPMARTTPLERKLQTADLVLGGREGGAIRTSVLAAPFQAEAALAYVPVLIEIDGDSLLAGHEGNVLPAEIYAYALAADGSVRDFFTQNMGLDLSKVEAGLRQSGFKFWGHFLLPPGSYTVRTVVRNAASGAAGVRSAPLKVPAFAEREAGLSAPLFPEPAGKWLLGRQQGATSGDFDYPFLLGGQPYIPAARPVVRAGASSQVVFVGYNLGEGSLSLLCRLLDPEGKAVEGVKMELESRSPGSITGQERLVARFEAGAVAAGDYTLEVTVGGGGSTQTSTIPITVEG